MAIVKKKEEETKQSTVNKAPDTTTLSSTATAPKYTQQQWSNNVTNAYNQLNKLTNTKPSAFTSQYDADIKNIYDKIMGRGQFQYDVNKDALYNQYKEQYTNLGRQAMEDTMGQAAALTGGYGSSYGQTAGQQVYNKYMTELNNMIPQLYQQAYDIYNQQGQDLYNKYSLADSARQNEYGMYRDKVSDYYQDYSNAYNMYANERNADQQAYENAFDKQYNLDKLAYQQQRDQIADSQWREQFDYEKQRDQVGDAQWQSQFDYQKQRDLVSDSQWQKEYDMSMNKFQQSLKADTSKGYSGLSSGDYSAIERIAAEGTEDQLDTYITQMYESGKISEDTAINLYEAFIKKQAATNPVLAVQSKYPIGNGINVAGYSNVWNKLTK
jgi:hypothetical protein